MQKKFTLEKKMIAQIRYYEEIYKIRDSSGEVIFVGSEALAKKFMKMLNTQPKKLKVKRKR